MMEDEPDPEEIKCRTRGDAMCSMKLVGFIDYTEKGERHGYQLFQCVTCHRQHSSDRRLQGQNE